MNRKDSFMISVIDIICLYVSETGSLIPFYVGIFVVVISFDSFMAVFRDLRLISLD